MVNGYTRPPMSMLPISSVRFILLLSYVFLLTKESSSLKSMIIKVPEAIKSGDTVTLTCEYDLENVPLYSIKWYWNEEEFYRFVPKESPPFRSFPVKLVDVDLSKSGENAVTLRGVQRQQTGDYKCEVSADAPFFHTDILVAHMIVADLPLGDPVMNIRDTKVEIGKEVNVECSLVGSHPAANITWFINNKEVRMSCTVLCSSAVILLVLAVFFGLLGHCNNDNKTIIACGLFILGGLSLGCGLITFVSALSETLTEIYEYHKDGPNGPDYDYRYGWCFFTAGAALVLTYVGSAFSFVGYLNRYTSIDDMVREMVPGADRKLREHKLSTEYLIRHSNPHPPSHQQYDPITTEQHIPLEQYEATECGPLLNKTPPDVCTTNRCQDFAAAADLSNAGALEINFCAAGASCNAHSQALAGQTIPITIKNHNTTAPLSFSNIPVSKYGTMPHSGTTLHQGFLGVSDMGSSSSNSSSGYCGKSKTLQHQRGRLPSKKCVKIESFQVPETSFEGFGKQRTNNALGYSGSAV